ncbi:GNAT family N-acetyltransferase [Lysobacter enzymogenes]|uniref:GNAT family N-acetyltransferase n=1 Tax=Lysobacter enzymogenes TaxID=69 RepID=UPI001A97373E|nr:GNAT family N-acetyltransferase [Lysobacter enzymogenes]QQP95939.1 GNAT family N-acetyltransferase [Lysobacter enzymogenes]
MTAPARNDDEFARHVEAFAHIHVGADSRALVANLATRAELVGDGERRYPASVDDGDIDGNAWVCSPRTTYGDYATEEAVRYAPAAATPLLRAAGRGLDGWLRRAGIDRAVAINNWWLSTNVYPQWRAGEAARLLGEALQRWPTHAVWLRSLNRDQHAAWLAECEALGFALIPSRQVYLFRDVAGSAQRRHNLRMDLKLAAKRPGRAHDGDIDEADYARIAWLYERLYMDKYSGFNPRYGERFLREWHRAGLLRFDGFRDESGQLLCIAGVFGFGGTATTPIVGYDTGLPQRLGLYRLLTATTFERAIATGDTVNFSAGAAEFKRLRGGEASIEYSAVYVRHMPARTRRAVAALSALTRRVGVPIMRRFGL